MPTTSDSIYTRSTGSDRLVDHLLLLFVIRFQGLRSSSAHATAYAALLLRRETDKFP
jgi:hypothetical protein